MVRITEELVRKKAEHNECIIGTLEELSLHQEDVEKIEHLHNWSKELQILYLQANLIPKIENLHKLKKLEYLNLAINNIEKIENLERCESLNKLDLTLNFIGDLESVCSLRNNIHLRELYLMGNPCADYEGYRNYVIAKLPQLKSLDNVDITHSERIKAVQMLAKIEPIIKKCQAKYAMSREEQKDRLSVMDETVDDDVFWHSKSEHAPETRIEMSRRSRLAKGKDEVKKKEKTMVSVFNKDGRPMNINQAKLKFTFDDSDADMFILNIEVYKYLDTSYIDVDLQPIYARVSIKGKIFQFVFPEEIFTDKSKVERSQTTGHLLLKLKRVISRPKPKKETPKKIETEKPKVNYLEVSHPNSSMDFSKIIQNNKEQKLIDENDEIPPLELV